MLVSYAKTDGFARISMDDGNVNVMSISMLTELMLAFERAEQARTIVILSAREGIFSAGFDTKILGRKNPQEVYEMVRLGAELAARVFLSHTSGGSLSAESCSLSAPALIVGALAVAHTTDDSDLRSKLLASCRENAGTLLGCGEHLTRSFFWEPAVPAILR
jgi:hypothetical protein